MLIINYRKTSKASYKKNEQNLSSNNCVLLSIFLKSLAFSNIKAHEKIELAIKIIITLLTTKSALKNNCQSEKSVAPPKPTTCVAISCSIKVNYL